MTEEERLRSIERGKELDRQIARDEQERKEALDKLFSQPTTVNLFTGRRRSGPPLGTLAVDRPKPNTSINRKRKRHSEANITSKPDARSAEAVRKPVGRPRKRTRIGPGAERVSSLPKEAEDVAQEQPSRVRAKRNTEKRAEAPTLPTPQGHKAAKRGRRRKDSPIENPATSGKPSSSKVTKGQAAPKRKAPKSQVSLRRSKRIANIVTRRPAD
jgi:hypothetical protein